MLLDMKEFMDFTANHAKKMLNDELARMDDHELAVKHLIHDDAGLRVEFVNDYVHARPPVFGLDISEKLFWQTYVMSGCGDCSRPPGTEWDIGRASEPSFMDKNLAAMRKVPGPGEPRVVVFQMDRDSPFEPRKLLVAYEEHGTVKPVVSDFDCFLSGTRGVKYDKPLSPDQVQLVEWMVTNIGRVLDERARPGADKSGSWFKHWLGVHKKAVEEGFYPKYPAYGCGDPKSYSITEVAVSRLKGEWRHVFSAA